MNAMLGLIPQDYWIWHFDQAGHPRITHLGGRTDSEEADQVAYSRNINLQEFHFIFSREEMAQFCDQFETFAAGLKDQDFIAVIHDGTLQQIAAQDFVSALDVDVPGRVHTSNKRVLSLCVERMKSELAGGADTQSFGYGMSLPDVPGS